MASVPPVAPVSATPTPYYSDDLVTLYHGDCREVTAWLDADVLVTDPPYGIAWRKGTNHAAKSKAHPGIANDGDTTARDEVLALWGERPGVVFGTWAAPFPPNRQTLVWRKPVDAGVVGSTTGYRRDTELIFLTGAWPILTSRWSSVIGTDGGKARYLTGHPHAKPDHLMQTLIERCPAGVIADPFAGSGSTLVAAKALGRRSIGVELDERYCEIAAKRALPGHSLWRCRLMAASKWAPRMLQLHPGVLEDPQIDGLSQGAFRLLMASLCYSVQHDTDWFIPNAAMRRIVPRFRARYATELVDAELFSPRGLDAYEIREPTSRTYTFGRPAWKVKRINSRAGIPIELRLAVYERDGHRCLACQSPDDLTLDHIHPFSLGGEDTLENLQTLCRPCNSRKGARV